MLENFVMNDKCAAGTGRFLDVIAKVLEVDVSKLEELDELSTKTLVFLLLAQFSLNQKLFHNLQVERRLKI
ncbi:2-hydroxyglutaryl-CoA dehydratase component A [Peptoniphilus harei]|uniref:2-hydroxyglutaryl-CoA dehydratase component A n=1 Tax=Peptoniphilus harei TaxID=54005 RepID=A0A2X1Z522_9FIRM|nr:2-hydroxyglutaryl-CoA dehydratase component A [Peptoniphilus harei]